MLSCRLTNVGGFSDPKKTRITSDQAVRARTPKIAL